MAVRSFQSWYDQGFAYAYFRPESGDFAPRKGGVYAVAT